MHATRPLLFALGATLLLAGPAFADWPEKPIRVVVPFGPGGSTDAMARMFQQAIEVNQLAGQPLVIVNKGGAGGTIGARDVLESEPDGHTFLLTQNAILTAEASGLIDFGYRDFEPVAQTGEVCMVSAVHESAPHETLEELLEAAKAEPDSLIFGANLGALNHIAGLMLQNESPGSVFRFVQIGGGTANFTALQGGHTDTTVFTAGEVVAYEAGGVRPLAYMAGERHPDLPDLPTAKEQGYDAQFCVQYYWFAPEGTAEEAIDGMADILEQAMQTEIVQQRLEEQIMAPSYRAGEELTELLASEYEKIAPVAQQAQQK